MTTLKTSRQRLLDAIEQCQLNKIISLVKKGYNIHMHNSFAQNFLVDILQKHHIDIHLRSKRFQIFQFLIQNYNLDIHSLDIYGKNLFNWSTNLNCTQEALYLLESSPGDIDILIRDHSGSCSLHYAVEHGNEILVHAIVNYLLRYRLRFDIKDAHNNTPEDLARKLGYEKIRHFLSQACRSTVYLSREIPNQSQIPTTAKSKSNSSFIESSEYFNFIETKINLAKNFEDWKTVAALRAFKRNSNDKNLNKLPDPMPHNTPHLSVSFPSQKLPSIRSISQSEQMFNLLEIQTSSSYRRPFIPIYNRPVNSNVPSRRTSNIQRPSMFQASHPRLSSIFNQRKRDSDVSQTSTSTLPDVQNHSSISTAHKQNRQSIVTTN